ncbi:unnamed protein product [Lampetra fluviatilis]
MAHRDTSACTRPTKVPLCARERDDSGTQAAARGDHPAEARGRQAGRLGGRLRRTVARESNQRRHRPVGAPGISRQAQRPLLTPALCVLPAGHVGTAGGAAAPPPPPGARCAPRVQMLRVVRPR